MRSVFGILDVACTGQLIALLALLAPTLTIALPGHHGVAAPLASDSTGGEHELNGRHAVLDALRVVLDPASVQEKAGARRTPHLGRTDDERRGDAGDLGGRLRRVLLDRFLYRVPAGRVGGEKGAIDPPAFDHHVQHSVEDGDVSSGPNGDEKVSRAGDGRHPRVDQDEARAVLARPPEVVGGDGRALADVRAGDQHDLGLRDVTPGICGSIEPGSSSMPLQRHHAEAAVVVDVRGAHGHTGELPHGYASRW